MDSKKKPRFEDVWDYPLTKHTEFYRIALEALKRAKRLQKLHDQRQHKEELTDDDAEYLGRKNGQIELVSIVAVVFSALSLEAFINHYASEKLSKSYFENYLDKLDLVSKWIVLPRLTTGKEMETGGRGMNMLRWLVRQRNELVHYKSKVKKISELDWRTDWVNLEDAAKSCDTVVTVIGELKKLDKKIEADWLSPEYSLW